ACFAAAALLPRRELGYAKSRSRKLLKRWEWVLPLHEATRRSWSRVPMWQPEHRRAADRRGLNYPCDMTDAEWAVEHGASVIRRVPMPPARPICGDAGDA